MPTNVDKPLATDLGALMPVASLEIEIVPDEPDEGVEIEFGDGVAESDTTQIEFSANLASYLSDKDLSSLAADLVSDYDDDVASRKDWIQTYVDGLELLGLKLEERSEPWEGACGVYHPMLAEALVRFQSETMMSTFPAAGPVRTKIVGKETPEKKEAAERVQEDMNYQLTDVMKEYRPEHERMLWGLGLAGDAFKKVYYDPQLGRQTAMFVPAEDIVVPYGASDLASAERVTHVMRKTKNALRKLQISGFYEDIDLGEPQNTLDEIEKKLAEKLGFRATSDARFKILEMHTYCDLPGFEHKDDDGNPTGIALPYVVTIEKGTQQVLAIRRNWREGDETYAPRQHFVHYGYIPGFGFYHFGLISLIGAYAKSSTSILRQLVDAGTLANLPGGFKARGMRVKGDDTPISPGEWRDVDIPSGTMRDNLLPLPYKEPSQTLNQLLGQIVEEGRRFANTADLQISDMSAQAPVGTTLAILERTLKNMTAIQARIHSAMKQELGMLKEIIAEYTPEEYNYDPSIGDRMAKRSDYDNVDVVPVSDPNAATMAQKIVQMQTVFQMAQANPQSYNMPMLNRMMLEVIGIKNADKLVPIEADIPQLDPVTENQNILMSKPVKAFINQDHEAHITVHMAAMQDPMLQQMLQNHPQAAALGQAMMAHISEHLGFAYRKRIEQQLGFSMPAQTDETGENKPMDPEIEAKLSPLLAQAAQRLLQQNQSQAQQQKAQQQAQDPLIQMQQQELALKAQDLQRKTQKDQTDAALKAKQIQADLLKAASQTKSARESEIMALSADILKHLSSQAHDANKQITAPVNPQPNKAE